MIGNTYTGAAYTNVPSIVGQTNFPLNEIGSSTATANDSFTKTAKRVVIYSVTVRTYVAGATFELQTHSGSTIASFAPTEAGTFSFGPIGLEINEGWRIVMGATGNTLLVSWKVLA